MILGNKKRAIQKILLTTITCFTVMLVQAQGPGFEDDVEDTPIDGGATLILAAAAGYGYKKITDRRKKNA